MRLFIAEKPSVAGDIASALDGNFTEKTGIMNPIMML